MTFGLVPELEAAKVRFSGRVENTWFALLLSGPDLRRGVGLPDTPDVPAERAHEHREES